MPNSPTIPAKCLGFYLQGREDGLKLKLAEVLEQVLPKFHDALESEPMRSPRDLVYEACQRAAEKQRGGRSQRKWTTDHEGEFTASGVDEATAYDAYLMGCIDETAGKIEGKVTDAIFEEYDGEPDGDPDDEEDDDADEGDDDDED